MRRINMRILVLVIILSMPMFVSCAGVADYHQKQAQEYTKVVKSEKQLAREFFVERWEFYSGMLDLALELYPNDIPPVISAIKIKLDAVEVDTELTDRELGRVWIARAFILSEGFRMLLDRLIPLAKLIL